MESKKEKLIKALSEGKTIQSNNSGKWVDFERQNQVDSPNWEYRSIENWRVKNGCKDCGVSLEDCDCLEKTVDYDNDEDMERASLEDFEKFIEREESPEKILCAANWYKELPLKNDDWLRLRGISPYNVDGGIVFCGWRHTCCLAQMNAVTGLRQCEAGEEVQGFLTNKNRFVTREEGLIIALEQNQIIDMTDIRGKQLYSENLY